MTPASRTGLVALVLTVFFGIAVAFHYWAAAYQGLDYPYDTFLFRNDDDMQVGPLPTAIHNFGDLYAPWQQARSLRPYDPAGSIFQSNYPPFAHAMLWPFTTLPFRTVLACYLVGSLCTVFGFCWLAFPHGTTLERFRSAWVLAFFAYPVQLALDRGNLETVAFGFLAGAYLAETRGRPRAAVALIGAATAIKIYPVLFLLRYLTRAEWRLAALGAGVAGALTVGSAAGMHGGTLFTLGEFRESLVHYGQVATYLGADAYSAGIPSGISVLARGIGLAGWPFVAQVLRQGLEYWRFAEVLILLAVGYACLRYRLDRWEGLYVAAGLPILLMRPAPDYRCIHLLLPLAALIPARLGSAEERVLPLLFGLVLAPVATAVADDAMRWGTVVRAACLTLILLMVLARARRRFKARGAEGA